MDDNVTSCIQQLVGRRLESVEKKDFSWYFSFGPGLLLMTEGPWRLILSDSIFVTSEDHAHQFGLPAPVDAGERVMQRTQNLEVSTTSVDSITGDLTVRFGEQVNLQLLQLSCGYEAWRAYIGESEIYCIGGGSLSFRQRPKGT